MNPFASPASSGFCRTHAGVKRHFALGDPVRAIEVSFFRTEIFLGTAGTEGTFVHGATGAEDIAFGKLRRAERAGHKTVAAADAGLFVDQDDAVVALINGINRTDGDTGGIGTMHARNRNRFLAGFTLIKRNPPTTFHPDGDMMPFLAGDDTAAAVNTAFHIA